MSSWRPLVAGTVAVFLTVLAFLAGPRATVPDGTELAPPATLQS